MIKINLLSVLEAEQSETRQTFFEFGGGSEKILEREYARLAWEAKKERLEEEGYDFGLMHFKARIDGSFQEVWQSMIAAHNERIQIPGLKKRIQNAEENWKKQLGKQIPDYITHIRETKPDSARAFLILSDQDIVTRLNQKKKQKNGFSMLLKQE